jgi:alkylation response protein AidB-like acyl-CoA dehydrogenase
MDETDDIALDMASRLFAELEETGAARALAHGTFANAEWARIEELGFPLALVPEALGGIGMDPVHALGLLRLAGQHALALPLADTMLANALSALCDTAPAPGVSALALGRAGQLPALTRRSDGWHLAGQVAQVPWGRFAQNVAVVAQAPEGLGIVSLNEPPPVAQQGVNLADEPRDDLAFDLAVPETAVARLPDAISHDALLARGAIIRSVLIAGALERVLAMCTRYALERVQFGKPIGRFQAIQQNLAVMAGHVVAARAAADLAAEAWEDPGTLVVGAAKVRTGEAAGAVAALAHQVHGAIGFAREHALHLFTRRLWSWRDEFGNEAFWARRVGALAQEAGPDGYWPLVTAT